MNSRGFITITFSGIAVLLFILGFVVPFNWFFGGDPAILLAGFVSLVLIVIAFVLNLKEGSNIVGSIMTLMGSYGIFFSANSWIRYFSEDLVAHANDPDFVYNTSGYDEQLTFVIVISSFILSMGLYSLVKRFSKPRKIENKSPT